MLSRFSRVTRVTSTYVRARPGSDRRLIRWRMQSSPKTEPPRSTEPRWMTVPLLTWYMASAGSSSVGTKTIDSSLSDMSTEHAVSMPRRKGIVISHGPFTWSESSPCSFCDRSIMRACCDLHTCTCSER